MRKKSEMKIGGKVLGGKKKKNGGIFVQDVCVFFFKIISIIIISQLF